ncbi:hypothetical protein [uncultured Ornithinimicrobium sp.]|uniref:hypothetical protein n=1 Tax=uncultured Ornithinimicrobium sp. TaxID=259307 RepID=UPI0025944ECA|nr:hypothetical protein [uncultured Ornithinimicrobium sp.]
MMIESDVVVLQRAIEETLPQPWTDWPGGWPDEIEAALLDAVLSIRARYGSPHTGVRGAVTRYRDAVGGGELDDLARLAAYDAVLLGQILDNAQRTSGRPKSGAIVEAAGNLVRAGARRAADLEPKTHKRAYTRVHGLGGVTWEYFTMLLGRPGVKADTWVTRWVSSHVGREVTSREAHDLLTQVAGRLVDPDMDSPHAFLTRLDHQIWRAARNGL